MLAFFLLQPLSAAVAESEAQVFNTAFTALYNGVFSVAAAYSSIPRVQLPGVTIEDGSGTATPYYARLSFNRSDLSTYTAVLAPSETEGSTWYYRLLQSARDSLSPMARLAANMLLEEGYIPGDAILDGVITVSFSDPQTSNICTWFDLMVLRDWSSVSFNVEVSVMVSGSLTGTPVAFTGQLEGKGESGGEAVVLNAVNMSCNGIPVTMSPIRFTILKKESLKDVS